MVNSIEFSLVYKYISSFPILFNCRPFKYAVDNSLISIGASGSVVNNPGSLESKPIITVYGSGNINLNINNQAVELLGVNNKIIINSELMDCYDDALSNLNHKMNGEFPSLDIGNNHITWTGNVNKVEVHPNWRWL